MNIDDLTEDQKAKARACKTTDELFALAKEEGYELSEEELDAIAGGKWSGCDANESERERNTEQDCPIRHCFTALGV